MDKPKNGFVITLQLPGGRALQLLVVFDTTGSMYSCLLQVRKNVDALCKALFGELGNVQIAIMAVGDYCDFETTYITVNTALTTNAAVVSKFIQEVSATNGGDSPEAYELALFKGLELKWSNDPKTTKLVVFVADEVPHRKGENNCGIKVAHDWKELVGEYAKRDIKIAAVQCLGNRHANYFYQGMANNTNGYYLQLDQFSELKNLILGLCYIQESPEKFQEFTKVVEAQQPLSRSEFNNFNVIGAGTTGFSTTVSDRFKVRKDGLIPVSPGRFQILPVTEKKKSLVFIEDQGLKYVRGGLFYELTMPERIQAKKKVVILDRSTGDMFTGDVARKLIGAEPGVALTINPKKIGGDLKEQYRIFIQSQSPVRDMDPGTTALFMPNYSEANWADDKA